jgi:phenylacetate-CoA ligase
MLFQLCFAAAAGQLHIAPSTVICGAEPLLPEIRTALERTFSAKVFDAWGCSETAILGYSCPKGFGLHLLDDLTIMEPVNAQGALVGVGVPSAKILVTNLFNTLLPLIRYEISDSVTILDTPFPCACGSHFRTIAPVQGRSEETFTYEGGVFVHPFTFDSILSQHPAIIEYQVRQIPNGARIVVRAVSEFDHCALEARIAVALATLGLTKAKVTIELVPEIARGTTGKLNRFVPVRQRTSEQEGKR